MVMEDITFVYILRSGHSNNFKIGVAKDIGARIKQLQTGSPYKLSLYQYFEAPTRKQAFKCESLLHRYFKSCKSRLMWGEWYRLSLQELELFRGLDYTGEVLDIIEGE